MRRESAARQIDLGLASVNSSVFSKDEKILLFLLATIQLAHIVDFMMMAPLGPQLIKSFGISPQEFGFLVSTYTLCAGISGFISSFYLDRFDRKNAFLVLVFGFALGTLICGFSPTFLVLVIARSITGLFGGALGSLIFAIVGDGISPHRRGQAIGMIMMGYSLASIGGVPLGLVLALQFQWSVPFLVLGYSALAFTFVIFFKMKPMKQHLVNIDLPKLNKIKKTTLVETLRMTGDQPSLLWGLFFIFCLVVGHYCIIPLLSLSFIANAGLKEAYLPWIYLFGGCFTIFASPLIGKKCDLHGPAKVFKQMLLLSLLPLILVTQLDQNPTWFIFIVSALFSTMTLGRMIPAMAMLNDLISNQHRGFYMSMIMSVQHFAAAFATLSAGFIVTQKSDGTLVHFGWVGGLAVALSLAALISAQKLKTNPSSSEVS